MTSPTSSAVLDLHTDADWRSLVDSLSGDELSAAAANIIEQLRAAGARSALVEYEYLDRDYSEDYGSFYARLFQRYRRRTRRFHFFRDDIVALSEQSGVIGLIAAMEASNARGDYLGFVIARPVLDAPIGRAVLGFVGPPEDGHASVQVRGPYETHPLGAKLTLQGMPFTQQDRRISACAQASIWMCGRHFNARHGGPWFSTAAISEAASKPTDSVISSSLPAGSNGLAADNMLRALRAMDRHPYVFAGELDDKRQVFWPPQLQPREVLARYVGSGIPVIAGLGPWKVGQRDGHAVVVVGDTFAPLLSSSLQTSFPTVAELSPYFLVHDDQRGPNLRMPVGPGAADAETPYNVAEHLHFLIVPLPDKVFITAEAAEITAWDRLDFYQREWPGLAAKHGHAIGGSIALAEHVIDGARRNQVIARTYLTIGWKYKARLHEAVASSVLRSHVAVHDLPRMVWVTEFGLLADLNKLDPEARRIFGHCVTDATSTGPSQAPLVTHFPGFLWLTRHLDPPFFAASKEDLFPLADDVLYRPRWRKPL